MLCFLLFALVMANISNKIIRNRPLTDKKLKPRLIKVSKPRYLNSPPIKKVSETKKKITKSNPRKAAIISGAICFLRTSTSSFKSCRLVFAYAETSFINLPISKNPKIQILLMKQNLTSLQISELIFKKVNRKGNHLGFYIQKGLASAFAKPFLSKRNSF